MITKTVALDLMSLSIHVLIPEISTTRIALVTPLFMLGFNQASGATVIHGILVLNMAMTALLLVPALSVHD